MQSSGSFPQQQQQHQQQQPQQQLYAYPPPQQQRPVQQYVAPASTEQLALQLHRGLKANVRSKGCSCLTGELWYFYDRNGVDIDISHNVGCCCSGTTFVKWSACSVKQVVVKDGCCTHNSFTRQSVGCVHKRSNKYCISCCGYDMCCPCWTLLYASCFPYICCRNMCVACCRSSAGLTGVCVDFEPRTVLDIVDPLLFHKSGAPSQQSMV